MSTQLGGLRDQVFNISTSDQSTMLEYANTVQLT